MVNGKTLKTSILQVFMVDASSLKAGRQGAYIPGKPGNLREFVNSGKVRENSGNLKFT